MFVVDTAGADVEPCSASIAREAAAMPSFSHSIRLGRR
jgi:hypothetical protein